MTEIKVSALPTVTSSALTDVIYAIQAGTSSQETLQQVFNLMLAQTILHNAGNPNSAVAGVVYQYCWDTVNSILYICTTSGTAGTAVWTQVSQAAASVITPAHGGTGVANPTAHTLPIAEGASNFTFVGPLTNGQVLIGSTGADPVPNTLTPGPGISISNGAGTVTISGTGSGIGWTEVTGTTQAMAADSGYVSNNAGLVTFTLPSTAAFGTALSVVGKGVGGWSIVLNTGQSIEVGSVATTVTTGSVSSTNRFDSIDLICTTANTVWTTLGAPQGNLTIV